MANNNDKFISRENAKTLWGYMIDLLTGKQNKLTFDNTPTQGSDNPVKSGGIFNALAGKGTYSKPQNGIPKTDLENAVQTSLGLADSALQSETDPTVPTWAKANSKPAYNSDEISDDNRTHKFATATQLAQISNNQTNILYTLNRTGKNCMDLQNAYANRCSGEGTQTKTDGANGEISLVLTNGVWSTYQSVGYVKPNTAYKLITYVSNFNSATSIFIKESLTSETNLTTGYIQDNGTIVTNIMTGSSEKIRICYNLNNSSTAKSNSITLRAMLIEASTYAIDSTYVVASLPNHDLTVIESEDRAALAEEIDAGAKNLWDFANAAIPTTSNPYGATYTKNDSAVTVTSINAWGRIALGTQSALKAGTYVFRCKISNYSIQNGNPRIYIQNAVPTGTVYSYASVPGNGTVEIPFTLPSDGVVYVAYYGNFSEVTGSTDSYTASENMICTKAAYNVSQKFVPYRFPNNNLGYKTYEINLSAVSINKAGSGVYWYKISVSSDFSKVVSVSLTDGKEIPNKRSFMPYIENQTGGSQAIGFLIADPDAPTTMTFNNGAYMSLTAFGYLK